MLDTEGGAVRPGRLRRWRDELVTDFYLVTTPVTRAGTDRRYLATVLFVGLVVFTFAVRLRLTHGGPSGDEPGYLVLSQTLQKYHSINVMLDYQHRDYWSFYAAPLDAHVVRAPDGSLFPLHSPGGPLLWLVPFILWGRAGAMGFMVVVSLLVLANIYKFLRERSIEPGYAFFTTLILAVGSPVYIYASMNFIEPIGALIIIYAVRVLFTRQPHRGRLFVAALGLAYAPWVHPRFVAISLVLAALLLVRVWVDRDIARFPALAVILAPLLISTVLLEAQSLSVFHSLNPGAAMSTYGNGPFQISPIAGTAGLLFDRQYGLITNFPIFLLLLPGVLFALRRPGRQVILVTALVIAPYWLLICTFVQWFAGDAPPARFLTVFIPLLSYPVAVLLQQARAWWLPVGAATLALAGYVLAVTSDIFPSGRFEVHGQPDTPMNELGRLIGKPFAHYAPSSFQPDQTAKFLIWALGTVVVGAALYAYARWWPERVEADRVEPESAVEPPAVLVTA